MFLNCIYVKRWKEAVSWSDSSSMVIDHPPFFKKKTPTIYIEWTFCILFFLKNLPRIPCLWIYDFHFLSLLLWGIIYILHFICNFLIFVSVLPILYYSFGSWAPWLDCSVSPTCLKHCICTAVESLPVFLGVSNPWCLTIPFGVCRVISPHPSSGSWLE